MPDDLQRLLKYIVRHYIGREEAKEVELDASSVDDVGDIVASQRRVIRDAEQRADMLASAFRDGLKRASDARRAGGNAISLDDRVPADNRIADALVYVLVGANLAQSAARETEPMHYIYTLSVDWERLGRVAREAGVDLESAIRHLS